MGLDSKIVLLQSHIFSYQQGVEISHYCGGWRQSAWQNMVITLHVLTIQMANDTFPH